MPVQTLRDYLDSHLVKYVVIQHSPAFTMQEVASATHIPGKELAKTVIVEIDGSLAMAVLPASQRADFEQLREAVGAQRVTLAREDVFRSRFPDCEPGAMPPFGNLYDMDVYVADTLAEDEQIAFNAGTHSQLVRMSYQDFERLVQPQILHFAVNA